MKTYTKLLGASIFTLASLSASAGNINVGGVVWDPNWTEGLTSEEDFLLKFDFTQWFSGSDVTAGSSAEMEASAEAAVGIGTVLSLLSPADPAESTGYFLSGVGEANRINDSITVFCPSCELTMAFGGLELFSDGTFDIAGAWLNIYVDNGSGVNYTDPLTTISEVGAAMDGNPTPWLTATFSLFEISSGSVDDGSVSAAIQVTGGLAANNFLNSLMGGAGFETGSAFFNTQTDAKFSEGGNGVLKSDTVVPEPASIALFGLSLLGLAGAARSKQS